MKFTLTVTTDNAAFSPRDCELARILKRLAEEVSNGDDDGPVYDLNGNGVGEWRISNDDGSAFD